MESDSVSSAWQTIYLDTNAFYGAHRHLLGAHDLGFKILYGPPLVSPPILFIGDQPGGRIRDEKVNERFGWPAQSEYATESWHLALQMQKMLGASFLLKCVGVNANFFRAPKADEWKLIDKGARQIFESFSIGQLDKVISLIKPKNIVTIGSATLDKFGSSRIAISGTKNRPLMKVGKIGPWEAYSTIHLSGAQISKIDRAAIAQEVRKLAATSTISWP